MNPIIEIKTTVVFTYVRNQQLITTIIYLQNDYPISIFYNTCRFIASTYNICTMDVICNNFKQHYHSKDKGMFEVSIEIYNKIVEALDKHLTNIVL